MANAAGALIIAPVHSEIMWIDLAGIPDAAVGDEVLFLGWSADQCIGLAEPCDKWGMTDFEVYMSLVKSRRKSTSTSD